MAVVSELVLLAMTLGSLSSWRDYSPVSIPSDPETDLAAKPTRSLYDLMEHFPTDKAIECPESDSKFRYPGQCKKYVTCKDFQAHTRSCPPGMSFDQKYGHCRLAFEVDCDDDLLSSNLCATNEVYTTCGSNCERTCYDLHKRMDCGYECVEGCRCRLGYVRAGIECVKPESCENANSLTNFFDRD